MFLQDVKIVLCRASGASNVGAICRVLKNMGLSELRLASPLPLDTEKIVSMAVNSGDIWENTRFFDTLSEAVADCSIVIGTTRRRGHHRKSISMTPRALSSWLAQRSGQAAIVFGNERTGLEASELDICNFASHIPVSDEQPSLNLSHAVQIYAYELFLALKEQNPVKGDWQPLNQTEVFTLVKSITDALADLDFYYKPGREAQELFLQDIISRAGLMDREGEYLKDIFIKAARLGSML